MKEPMYYCPVCANIILACSSKEHLQIEKMECKYCESKIISTEEDVKFFAKYGYENNIFYFDAVRELYVYSNPLFDKSKCDHRVALEKAEQDEADQYHREMTTHSSNVPKCPTCGSTNIRHIGGGERAVSVIGLGLFSGKLGKNYECGSCKARW